MVSVGAQTLQLRPYQVEAIDGVRQAWRQHRSTLLVLATGLGKTFCFTEIARLRRARGAKRTLVVAHRRELISQAAASMDRAGLSVEIEMGERRALVHEGMYGLSDTVMASMQSMQGRRLRAWPEDAFDTVIIDEAHRATCRSILNILEHFSGALVLGVTATPDRGDGVGLGNVFESVAYEYGIREGIAAGYLAPIVCKRIHCADLDVSKVSSKGGGDLRPGELEQALTVDPVLHQMADPIVREAGDRKTIVFTAGVAQAHALAQVMSAYTDPSKIAAADGSTPHDVRDGYVEAFKRGDLQFLINCGLYTEGFDAPETSCIAMARPTKSRALYTQCIGRGTRLAPGKKDCVILDFTGASGQHKLVNPADVLAGKDLPDDIRSDLQRELSTEGVIDVEAALEAAEERAKERLARIEEEKRRQRVRAEVTYMAEEVDPFGGAVSTCGTERGPRATASQLRALERWGVKPPKKPSRGEASRLLDQLSDRKRQGLCTYKQARVLAKHGINPDVGFAEASGAIDKLASSGWSPRVKAELQACLGTTGGSR